MPSNPLAGLRRASALAGAVMTLSVACGGPATQGGPSPEGAPMSPPLILTAAHVVTLADSAPPASPGGEAPDAVVVSAGRIVFVGPRDAARAAAGPEAVEHDYPGATIVPGLVDAHAHLTGLGKALMEVDLNGAHSVDEAVERVRAAAANGPKEGFVEGRGWDQNDWPGQAFPEHGPLSAAFPDRPVALRRVDGHALWVNAAALRLAGIDAKTPDPAGGKLLRDAGGAPTGVLLDAAMTLVTSRMPEPTPGQIRAWLEASLGACHRVGLTGVHDAGATSAQLAVMEAMAIRGELPLRVHVMLDADDPANAVRLAAGPKAGDFVSVRGVKIFADGALGSRGAWLSSPYSDAPDTSGIPIVHGEVLRAQVRRAADTGFQVSVHAIGDAAAHDVVEAYAAVLTPGNDRRFRVEHAQVVRPEDRATMARLGIIASMQPTHATSDMDWAERRLGPERVRWAYAWQSMRRDGVVLALGSDFPVERPDALPGLRAAITRADAHGAPAGGWYPEERLTPEQALRGFTTDAAFAGFEEARRGRIAAGFDADLTVLNADPLTLPAAGWDSLAIVATYVAGQPVYRAGR